MIASASVQGDRGSVGLFLRSLSKHGTEWMPFAPCVSWLSSTGLKKDTQFGVDQQVRTWIGDVLGGRGQDKAWEVIGGYWRWVYFDRQVDGWGLEMIEVVWDKIIEQLHILKLFFKKRS